MGRLNIPPPRAHLQGTLALFDALVRLSGGHAQAARVRTWLMRPQDLPPSVVPEQNSLKYDMYWTQEGDQTRWGFTICDRYEARRLPWPTLAGQLGGAYRTDGLQALTEGLDGDPALTLSLGFDHPTAPPRLKLYLQEELWDAGVGTAARVRPLLDRVVPGCTLPGWVPADRRVGVLSLECRPTGETGFKVYLGGATPQAAAAGAPDQAQALAQAMAETSTLGDGWYYLTLRLRPAEPVRYALNRIYNTVQLGFSAGGRGLESAWDDVGRQFARAGRQDAFDALTDVVRHLPGVRVVPTATALEHGCASADVYFAAWARQ